MEEKTVRINKYLANFGIASRRDIKAFLKHQVITVNGKRINKPGLRINPTNADIRLNGNKVKQPKLVYYLLNKPKGVVSTTSDEYGRKNVTSFIPSNERIYPVGRLDKNTSGLILLTNDGELTNHLTHPKYHVDKVYRLIIEKITEEQLHALRNGVLLDDGITAPAEVTVLKNSLLEMKIHEGRNRQIRRMCETVGIKLLELQRIKFGPLSIRNLPLGNFRKLTKNEIRMLRKGENISIDNISNSDILK